MCSSSSVATAQYGMTGRRSTRQISECAAGGRPWTLDETHLVLGCTVHELFPRSKICAAVIDLIAIALVVGHRFSLEDVTKNDSRASKLKIRCSKASPRSTGDMTPSRRPCSHSLCHHYRPVCLGQRDSYYIARHTTCLRACAGRPLAIQYDVRLANSRRDQRIVVTKPPLPQASNMG